MAWRFLITAALAAVLLSGPVAAQQMDFQTWLAGVRQEALARGISPQTLDRALAGVRYNPRIIELDQQQPEFRRTFWDYLDRLVSDARVREGRAMLARHGALLNRVGQRWQVQPRFIVAFWGLESSYGAYKGSFPVIEAVATLAYDPRRADYFRGELLNALTIVDRGDITPEAMKGSWAGAMGQTQFMPSNYLDYALDHDGDGRRDLFNSLPDIFASTANYLHDIGWHGDETWGRQVRVPAGFDWRLAGLETQKPLAEWQRLGVRRLNGQDLPRVAMDASLILPAGHRGPAFLVYHNFRKIMEWNTSVYYALAVGVLADRLVGLPGPTGPRVAEQPMSRQEVIELQTRLAAQGYPVGEIDGIAGRMTGAALRQYQIAHGLPADGYATHDMLAHLRATGGGQ